MITDCHDLLILIMLLWILYWEFFLIFLIFLILRVFFNQPMGVIIDCAAYCRRG